MKIKEVKQLDTKELVEKIQKTPCDDNNRPFEDMKIIKAVVVK